MDTANLEVAKRYVALIARPETLEEFRGLFRPGAVIYAPFAPAEGTTIEGFLSFIRRIFDMFDMLSFTVDRLVEASGRVAVYWTLSGRHVRSFDDTKPTHKQITFSGSHTLSIVEGTITTVHIEFDLIGYLTQIGGLPAV